MEEIVQIYGISKMTVSKQSPHSSDKSRSSALG